MASQTDQISRGWLFRLLKLRVWIFEHLRPSDLQVTLFWAGVIGFVGAISSVVFRRLTQFVLWILTKQNGGLVESFSNLAWWQRLLVPAVGGALAGFTIYFGTRLSPRKSSTDYMEAIVLGDGIVPARLSFVKCLSALFSIASGGSIGREGPLVQLSAVLASLIGRARGTQTLQLRLLVACGAAAGIASAYNAPIGGALFIAEIVLRSVAMESLGPLIFSSVVATLTVRHFLGSDPLYEIQIPEVRLNSNWEIIPYLALGLTAGLVAPWFLRLLRASENAFSKTNMPVFLKLALGGLIVGSLAIWHPEVCGNGYSTINGVLHGELIWQGVLLILAFKIIATAATFGSGAVGGVFTPTLFVGACVGDIFSHLAQSVWPGPALVPSAFALVGMGAFLAATTHAPIMAILILFELTLDYQIIMPLMLACVVAHYTSLAFEKKSIYAESLQRKGAGSFRQFASMSVAELMKKNPATVLETASFTDIAQSFITNRFKYLYVVDAEKHFRGAISLHDIKSYLNEPELAGIVIARDIVREGFPTIAPSEPLTDALDKFSKHDGERLPVIEAPGSQLVGSLSKTDLILALAERAKTPEQN